MIKECILTKNMESIILRHMRIRCHKCGKVIKIGDRLIASTSGRKHNKYYHSKCFRRVNS